MTDTPPARVGSLRASRIIDSHIHFWDRDVTPVAWLEGLPISHRHDPSGIPAAIGDVPVAGLVFVQAEADPALSEVRWVEGLGAEHPGTPPVLGIVARAALESTDVEAELAVLRGRPRVVGIRRTIQAEAPDFAMRLIPGLRVVAAAGYTFDVCVTDDQLASVADLLDAVDTGVHSGRYVLDHLGKPQVGVAAALPEWRTQLERLAAHPGVWCKLSGLFTEVREGPADTAAVAPYLEVAIEVFGTDRVLYGSDWPVSTLAGRTYQDWVETVATVLGPDQEVQEAVFADNAISCYALPGV